MSIEVAAALVICLRDALAERPSPPAQTCLRAGGEVELGIAVNEDECRCGLGWVRETQFYPSSTFPVEDESWQPCGTTQYALGLEMGVARCAEWGTAETLPTCTQWTALATQLSSDRDAMIAAACCLKAQLGALIDDPSAPLVFRGWEPREIEGMCAGGTLQIIVPILA